MQVKYKDRVGQRFSKLLIKSLVIRVRSNGKEETLGVCQCDCGVEKNILMSSIIRGSTNSCGLCVSEYIGTVFGKLKIISVFRKDKTTFANCVCECGVEKAIRLAAIKRGHTKSCGCYNVGLLKIRGISSGTHRQSSGVNRTSVYTIWRGMIQRCYDRRSPQFPDYGGRGITICDEWRHSFETFFSDMGHRPENLSIDRIDNDKGYSKDNCQWSTVKEQARNRRSNKLFTINGETKCIAEWSDFYGIVSYGTTQQRIRRNRMDTFTALTLISQVPRRPKSVE
jgi:hypothetical protein